MGFPFENSDGEAKEEVGYPKQTKTRLRKGLFAALFPGDSCIHRRGRWPMGQVPKGHGWR